MMSTLKFAILSFGVAFVSLFTSGAAVANAERDAEQLAIFASGPSVFVPILNQFVVERVDYLIQAVPLDFH